MKPDVEGADAARLRETVDEFRWAANYVVAHAWQGEYETTSKAQLQEETYDDVRGQTRLHATLVQNVRNKAADAVQGVVARWKQGDAGKPHFSKPTVVYDKRCATFHDEYVSLATVDGRIETDYVLPDESRDTSHSRYLDTDDYEVSGTLNANGEYEASAGVSGQSGSPRENPSADAQSARRQTQSDGTRNEARPSDRAK